MKLSTARFAVSAGLAAMLALGGCSFSSKTETTTSVSDGNTTTTTTTTTENGNTTSETTVTNDTAATNQTAAADQDISKLKSYTLDDYGIAYDLPEGFVFTEVNTDINTSNGPAVAFQISDNAKSSGFLRFVQSDTKIDVLDEAFLNERAEEEKQTVEQAGGTVADVSTGEIHREDKKFPYIKLEVEKDGATNYLEIMYFTLDNDEEDTHAVAQLGAASDNADTVDNIITGFSIK